MPDYLCPGCSVIEPWEHRCHGDGCPCSVCKKPTVEELAEFRDAYEQQDEDRLEGLRTRGMGHTARGERGRFGKVPSRKWTAG